MERLFLFGCSRALFIFSTSIYQLLYLGHIHMKYLQKDYPLFLMRMHAKKKGFSKVEVDKTSFLLYFYPTVSPFFASSLHCKHTHIRSSFFHQKKDSHGSKSCCCIVLSILVALQSQFDRYFFLYKKKNPFAFLIFFSLAGCYI